MVYDDIITIYITCSEREGKMLDNLPKNFNQFLNILICLRGIIEPLEHADFFTKGSYYCMLKKVDTGKSSRVKVES